MEKITRSRIKKVFKGIIEKPAKSVEFVCNIGDESIYRVFNEKFEIYVCMHDKTPMSYADSLDYYK